ncbi:hypothetical protein Y032_0024g969 [Ancylostoma ceylanicum]|uniref:Secreted protein n=1 Tax=Ancylostoma ceylanicum TaxID=53326 RepID=A0A016UWR2_9BILA|nr:hypothetical protein Y032_0024g969 [Ancylostoma ceylanicum]
MNTVPVLYCSLIFVGLRQAYCGSLTETERYLTESSQILRRRVVSDADHDHHLNANSVSSRHFLSTFYCVTTQK